MAYSMGWVYSHVSSLLTCHVVASPGGDSLSIVWIVPTAGVVHRPGSCPPQARKVIPSGPSKTHSKHAGNSAPVQHAAPETKGVLSRKSSGKHQCRHVGLNTNRGLNVDNGGDNVDIEMDNRRMNWTMARVRRETLAAVRTRNRTVQDALVEWLDHVNHGDTLGTAGVGAVVDDAVGASSAAPGLNAGSTSGQPATSIGVRAVPKKSQGVKRV
jgi:hypothetical protein